MYSKNQVDVYGAYVCTIGQNGFARGFGCLSGRLSFPFQRRPVLVLDCRRRRDQAPQILHKVPRAAAGGATWTIGPVYGLYDRSVETTITYNPNPVPLRPSTWSQLHSYSQALDFFLQTHHCLLRPIIGDGDQMAIQVCSTGSPLRLTPNTLPARAFFPILKRA